MMTNISEIEQKTIAVAQSLSTYDEDALYALIGKQDEAIDRDPVLAFDPALNPGYDSSHMGLLDDVKALGRRIAKKWARAVYEVVCGSRRDDTARDQLLSALNISEAAAIGAVTAILLPIVSPPIAAAVAVVIVKKFLIPAGGEICAFWSEELDAA